MNKKAEGPIGFIFTSIVFVILWAVFFGPWLVDVGRNAIEVDGLTGIAAFFYANLNLAVFIGFILGIMAYMYFTGE